MTIIFANHEDDDSRVLTTMWQGLPNVKLIEILPSHRKNFEQRVDRAISEEDDTLIMTGHGTTHGLLHPNFFLGEYLIHENNLEFIHAKNIICDWCNASTFVANHNMHNTFATSMFISNVNEAYDNGIMDYDQEFINRSGLRYCADVRQLLLDRVPLNQWTMILGAKMDLDDQIDVFNRQGLYYND